MIACERPGKQDRQGREDVHAIAWALVGEQRQTASLVIQAERERLASADAELIELVGERDAIAATPKYDVYQDRDAGQEAGGWRLAAWSSHKLIGGRARLR